MDCGGYFIIRRVRLELFLSREGMHVVCYGYIGINLDRNIESHLYSLTETDKRRST